MAQIETDEEKQGRAVQLDLYAKINDKMEIKQLRNDLDLVSDEELAAALGLETHTLATWRSEGFGPDFCKLGKPVFYRRVDVKRWIDERLNSVLAAKTKKAA